MEDSQVWLGDIGLPKDSSLEETLEQMMDANLMKSSLVNIMLMVQGVLAKRVEEHPLATG